MIWITITGVIIVGFAYVILFGAPYVPSQRRYVRRAFEQLYPLSSKDVLVDVGSGDGLVLRIAAGMGATAIGYEIHPVFVFISRLLSRRFKKVTIHLANFWRVKLPAGTTVVYAFTVSRDGNKLAGRLQQEVNRLGHDMTLLCYGSPLPVLSPDKTFEAYSLYVFHPLQPRKAQV